jgi:hypothetical protein
MAFGGGKVTFVWAARITGSGYKIVAAMATAEGTLTAEPRTVFQAPASSYDFYCGSTPAIAWDGTEFVIAWIDCGTILHALRIDQLGNPIDAPFDVAIGVPLVVMGPSIVPTADGVNIIYTRTDASNGDAPRAFKRSLARLPSAPPRRRVVTH